MTFEPAAVEALLRSFLPDSPSLCVQSISPLTGGWSTETMRVLATADGGELDIVLRRAPEDGVLAPYDLPREARIMRALAGSTVPVPRVIGCDAEGAYLGQPCLATEFVQGEPLSFFGQTTSPSDERLPAYFGMLATIHRIEWPLFDLTFLEDAPGGVEGELQRAEAKLELHGGATAVEREMLAWLREHAPDDVRTAFLHSDPNPANYLFAGTQVAAVLDWELALLGDPRIDLGFFAAIQSVLGDLWSLSTDTFLRGYATSSGAEPLHMDYFEAVGLYRLGGFLFAAERLRGTDITPLRERLQQRFRVIAHL